MIDNTMIGEKPEIQYYNSMGIDMVRVPYNIIEISPSIFTWREISVKFTKFNYNGLVDELISVKYSPDAMTAIINNYLLDQNDADAKSEFNEMQKYRKEAKLIAHEILGDK